MATLSESAACYQPSIVEIGCRETVEITDNLYKVRELCFLLSALGGGIMSLDF